MVKTSYGLAGIRNDFVTANEEAIKSDLKVIKEWLDISSAIGTSILRIFTGRNLPSSYSKEQK